MEYSWKYYYNTMSGADHDVEKTNVVLEPQINIINRLIDDMEKTFIQCLEIAARKNHDYGGTNNDPYANFKNSIFAGVSVEKGIMVRLMDKMSRVSSLLDKDKNLVTDESIDDTINDAINYLAILKSYRKNKK